MRIYVQHCTKFSLLSAQVLAHCMKCFQVMSFHGFIHRFSHAQHHGRLLITQNTQTKADFTILCLQTLSSCLLEGKYSHSCVSSTISSHQNTRACVGGGTAEKKLMLKGNIYWKILVCFNYGWINYLCYSHAWIIPTKHNTVCWNILSGKNLQRGNLNCSQGEREKKFS